MNVFYLEELIVQNKMEESETSIIQLYLSRTSRTNSAKEFNRYYWKHYRERQRECGCRWKYK